MKLLIAINKKGDEPKIVFSSNNNQAVQDELDKVKEGNYLTEVWTLGMRTKAYYGQGIVKKAPAKKVAKKKVVTESE